VLILVTGDLEGFASVVYHLRRMAWYLIQVPDLLVLMLFSVPAAILLARMRGSGTSHRHRAALVTACLLVSFIGFYLALPLAGDFAVVPRYYVQIIPFVLLSIFAWLEARLGTRKTLVWAAYLLLFFLVNANGRLYPSRDVNDFALQERSGGYEDLLGLQMLGVRSLEAVGDSIPVFYAQPVHYWLSYPFMGYSDGPLPRGHSIRHEERFRRGRLANFPSEFIMLYEHPWLGGEIIQLVRFRAERDPEWEVRSTPLEYGRMKSVLLHIRRTSQGD
jgi:hypothetical protein